VRAQPARAGQCGSTSRAIFPLLGDLNFFAKLISTVRAGLFEDVSTSGRKLAIFDGLRGLAVLTVYLSHSSGFRERLTPWTSFHGTGHLGVYLFFVLSAFLLGYTMLERGKVTFGSFYLRRFFRIAPLFYLIVTIVFAVQLWTHKVDEYNLFVRSYPLGVGSSRLDAFAGYLLDLCFVQGHSPFWTIPCEFQFYFILPLLIWVLLRYRGRAAWLFGVVALAYGVWGYLAEGGFRPAPVLAIIPHHSQYFDVFLFGVLAAWLYCQPKFRAWIEREKTTVNVLFYSALAALVLVTLTFVPEYFFGLGYSRFSQVDLGVLTLKTRLFARFTSLFYGPLVAFCVLVCACRENLLTRIARWRWLQVVGITGFSFYLIHFPMIRAMNALFGLPPISGGQLAWTVREPLAFITGFALSYIVAIALYLCVEKPFMAMSRRFVMKTPKADVPSANPAI
jgi:peptidoglycan/LPS O-acetylase OafA/YrhL